jgi:hypothetical protein
MRERLGLGVALLFVLACSGLGRADWAKDGAPRCYRNDRGLTAQLVPEDGETRVLLQRGPGDDQLAATASGTGPELQLHGTWVRSGKRQRLRLRPTAEALVIEGLKDKPVKLAASGCMAG